LRYVRAHGSDEWTEELAGWLASRDAGSAVTEIAEVLGAAGREALGSLRRDSRLAALVQMLLSGQGEHYETTSSRADMVGVDTGGTSGLRDVGGAQRTARRDRPSLGAGPRSEPGRGDHDATFLGGYGELGGHGTGRTASHTGPR
jgi:hypothetical protein